MLRPAITQLISKNDSYYSLVIGVAKRAREIADELAEEKKTLFHIQGMKFYVYRCRRE